MHESCQLLHGAELTSAVHGITLTDHFIGLNNCTDCSMKKYMSYMCMYTRFLINAHACIVNNTHTHNITYAQSYIIA